MTPTRDPVDGPDDPTVGARAGIARTLEEWAAAIEEGDLSRLASLVTSASVP